MGEDDSWNPDANDWGDAEFEASEGSDDDGDATVPCPYCGREIQEDSPRCPHCEQYISDEDAPPRRKSWWMILGDGGVPVCGVSLDSHAIRSVVG